MPYICTYPNCRDGVRMYRSRHDWTEHEKKAHRSVWRCFNHPDMTFNSPSELQSHLESEHGDLVATTQVQTLVTLGESSVSDSRTNCPICLVRGPFHKGMTNHVAFHLEKFALFSIRGHLTADDDSKIVQALGSSACSERSDLSFEIESNRSEDRSAVQALHSSVGGLRLQNKNPTVSLRPLSLNSTKLTLR